MIGPGLVVVEKFFRRRRRHRRRRHLGMDPNKLGICITNVEYSIVMSGGPMAPSCETVTLPAVRVPRVRFSYGRVFKY